jgi:hypothetical protein
LAPATLEQQLKDSSRPLPGGCAKGCGAGLVDATAALIAYGGNLPVAPSPVTFNDLDGTSKDTFQVPPVKGVEYLVGGTVVEPGTYPAIGTVTVTARAAKDYVLVRGATTKWAHTFKSTRIKITDFNGDGKPDVLARDTKGALWLYPGNGSGGWLAARQIGSGWNVMTAIEAPGDFNGDGKADVIARDGNGVLWLYPGNGSGGWLAAKQIGWGWNVMSAIDGPGDFNGDGNADILARNSGGGLLLYPGDGAGGWLPAKQIGWGWNVMTAIEGPGDFNGDGQVDVLGRNSAGDLILYEGYGSGGFFRSYQVGSGWNVMSAIF